MSPRYALSKPAVRDLDKIMAYLVEHGGRGVARYVLGRIRDALRLLASAPDAGHRREDLTAAPVKFWAVFSYLIVYDPVPRPIQIVRVLHASRDVSAILDPTARGDGS